MIPARHESAGVTRPRRLFIYDGDCAFCRLWVDHWRRLTGETVDYAPFQEVEDQFPHIPHPAFERGVQLVLPDGTVYSNAEAVFRLLEDAPGRGWLARAYEHIPGFAFASERAYAVIGRQRELGYHVTRLLWGAPGPHGLLLTRWLFLRGYGLIYLIFFVSLAVQILGLHGSGGILPAADLVARARDAYAGPDLAYHVPTLALLDTSDAFLQFLCWGGAALAVAIILNVLTAPALLLAWAFALSLVTIGRTFLSFQWELLLLEGGFLAIFLGHWRLPGLGQARPPSLVVIYLLRWLIFRLMFSSGIIKILSGDPTWRDLTALDYHYFTQPIPNPVAWYMAQLPLAFHELSVLFMYAAELLVPLLFWLPRRPRIAGALVTIALQLLILATGNFAYFNWLTIVLTIPLLDDESLRRLFPRRLAAAVENRVTTAPRSPRWRALRGVGLAVLCVLIVVPTGARFLTTVTGRNIADDFPPALSSAIYASYRFRIAGGYGLFANMTTRRPEIIVEGSRDGETWLAYDFRYKPGDPDRMPPFVAPHQPRLDWQMWFAALGRTYERSPWFVSFARRLLEGAPDVLALLEDNPFPDEPPRFLRARLMDYRFTTGAERAATGAWWARREAGDFLPVVSLEDFRSR